jgi:hypothetical protein
MDEQLCNVRTTLKALERLGVPSESIRRNVGMTEAELVAGYCPPSTAERLLKFAEQQRYHAQMLERSRRAVPLR